ncbi:MAG: DNA-directed RNA polymerase subunit omega [Planctomycetota bacterium]
MLDIDQEDQLVDKVGGKLRLTALMQKRMVELKRGARPLVKLDGKKDLSTIVVEEILQDKIELAERTPSDTTLIEDVRRIEQAEEKEPEKEIYGSDLKRIKEQRIKELSALLNPTKK